MPRRLNGTQDSDGRRSRWARDSSVSDFSIRHMMITQVVSGDGSRLEVGEANTMPGFERTISRANGLFAIEYVAPTEP